MYQTLWMVCSSFWLMASCVNVMGSVVEEPPMTYAHLLHHGSTKMRPGPSGTSFTWRWQETMSPNRHLPTWKPSWLGACLKNEATNHVLNQEGYVGHLCLGPDKKSSKRLPMDLARPHPPHRHARSWSSPPGAPWVSQAISTPALRRSATNCTPSPGTASRRPPEVCALDLKKETHIYLQHLATACSHKASASSNRSSLETPWQSL